MATVPGRARTVAMVSIAAAALTVTAGSSPVAADETPGPAGAIDASDPDLQLPAGAKLANPKVLGIEAKVLDIKFIVASDGGAERREQSNDHIKVALQSEVTFGKDSFTLTSDADARIAGIAKSITRQGATEVNVVGYTDNLGSYQHGVVLSKARARAVQKELAQHLDPEVTYNIRGRSEDDPIADNSTEAGRKKNRRVEISYPRTP